MPPPQLSRQSSYFPLWHLVNPAQHVKDCLGAAAGDGHSEGKSSGGIGQSKRRCNGCRGEQPRPNEALTHKERVFQGDFDDIPSDNEGSEDDHSENDQDAEMRG